MRDIEVTTAQVIHKETARDMIVRDESGKTVSLETLSPDVKKGDQGIVLEFGDRKVFIREPYDGGF